MFQKCHVIQILLASSKTLTAQKV